MFFNNYKSYFKYYVYDFFFTNLVCNLKTIILALIDSIQLPLPRINII